jgi:gamma-glutamyl-gamma-aminobutyrate hydrolase PuuD
MLNLQYKTALWPIELKSNYLYAMLYKKEKKYNDLLTEYNKLLKYEDYILVSSYAEKEIGPLTAIIKAVDMDKDNISKLHQQIDLCDGIILQGGTDYYPYDMVAIEYICEKDIPILGICLGMQSMGVAFGASLSKVPHHCYPGVNYVHDVEIKECSNLYKVFGKNKIKVNSRHNEMIEKPTGIDVVGCSNQVIEAVEKSDKAFFIGVQWHPEDMLTYDEDSFKIFDALFSACEKYHSDHHKM